MSDIDEFIERWKASGGSEIANFQTFAGELTQLFCLDPAKVEDARGRTTTSLLGAR